MSLHSSALLHGHCLPALLLHGYNSLLLQALLVALETPRSPRGLHLLARHSQAFASALLFFINSAMSHSSSSPPTTHHSAPSPIHVSQQPFTSSTSGHKLEFSSGHSQHPGLQADSSSSLQAGVAAMSAHARKVFQHSSNGISGNTPTAKALIQTLPLEQGGVLREHPLHNGSIHLAAAVAVSHRCLESMLARESVFSLPPTQVAQALFSPAVVFAADSSRVGWGLTEGAGVFVGCCSLVTAGLRHHTGAVKRCMALFGESTRSLLKALMDWAQSISR